MGTVLPSRFTMVSNGCGHASVAMSLSPWQPTATP